MSPKGLYAKACLWGTLLEIERPQSPCLLVSLLLPDHEVSHCAALCRAAGPIYHGQNVHNCEPSIKALL